MGLLDWPSTFSGGTHPPDLKETTNDRSIQDLSLPDVLAVPMDQHAGKPAQPTVEPGDRVLKGQLIGEAAEGISASVHAPATGKVKDLKNQLMSSGDKSKCVQINVESDAGETKYYQAYSCAAEPSPEEIITQVKTAGVVGLGGAGFPTHVKLAPDEDVDTVVLNGCECEPFLTSDHRTMLERPGAVVDGLRLIKKALGADRGIIGVEDNKRDAASRLAEETEGTEDLAVELVETKYPHGVENMLIYSLTGRKMSASQLPADVGVGVNNVNTAAAVSDAVLKGKPLIDRPVTVSGPGVDVPGNYRIVTGTPFEHILKETEMNDKTKLVLDGGPMMGTPQAELEIPAVKSTAGVTALTENFLNHRDEHSCIRCARCVSRCPQKLVPTKLAKLIKTEDYEQAKQLDVNNCLECGVCSYVCPSNIPLVHWLRIGKSKT